MTPMRADDAYFVRMAGPGDLAALMAVRAAVGPGFTSLALPDDMLAQRLDAVKRSAGAQISSPGEERYILTLVHAPTGAVVGLAQVKATVGVTQPFFNFRILQIAAASHAAQRRYDMDVLILVNECTGCTEVGSLFVEPAHRAGGWGRLLAQARYILIAAAPQRFAPRVVSELRGVLTKEGVSPFWENLGRHFFRMEFAEADRLSASGDSQFILDLMPKYPIYVDLLAQEARDVIGRCHPDGEPAFALLKQEGFRYERVIDIFDGGPLVSSPRDQIRTVREARRMKLREGAGEALALLANPNVASFACVRAQVKLDGDGVAAPKFVFDRLGLAPGEEALVWHGA